MTSISFRPRPGRGDACDLLLFQVGRNREEREKFVSASAYANNGNGNPRALRRPGQLPRRASGRDDSELVGKRLAARKGSPLFAQTETLDNLSIPIRVATIEVVQQPTSPVDHHDQPASRCMVLHMRLKMRSQVVDALAQQGNLHFGRARCPAGGSGIARSTLT